MTVPGRARSTDRRYYLRYTTCTRRCRGSHGPASHPYISLHHDHHHRIILSFDLDFIVISRRPGVDSNRARPIMMIMIVTVTVQQGVGCYRGVGFLC